MSSPTSTHSGGSRSTSRSLLARVRANDAAAWSRLVELYAPYVFVQCRRARLAPEDTADVFQEVFQAAFARLDGFRKERPGDTFRGWLRTIARNKIHDHFRRLERQPRAVGGSQIQARLAQCQAPPDAHGGACSTGSSELREGQAGESGLTSAGDAERELFQRALAVVRSRFRDRTWRAFEATVLEGRAPRDVASDLGMQPGAVRVAKCRVLQRLREELGDL